MKTQGSNVLKFLFFLSIGILLIWLALRGRSDEEITNIKLAISQSDYSWIILSIFISGLSHFFRALRWNLLLDPLGHKPKVYNTFFAVMVGYLANFALPRLGEVSRCGILTKYEKIPFTESFGTVIAERAFDLVCVILLFFSILALEFEKISGIANDLIFKTVSNKLHVLLQKPVFLIICLIGFISAIALFYYFRKKIQSAVSGKTKGFLKGLLDGLKSIKNIDKPIWFIVHTILIWLMYILQAYVCFFAFSETVQLGLIVAIVIIVFGSISVIVVPGGTGAYQLIVINILTSVYFVNEAVAFAYSWAVWTAQFILILSLGLLSLLLLSLLNKESSQSV